MNDCISRDELLDSIRNDVAPFNVAMVFRHIHNMPAADVAPVRHGRWIRPHWKNSVSCADCSECGAEAHHAEYRGVQKYYKICPNCGAKMDRKEDGHEAG